MTKPKTIPEIIKDAVDEDAELQAEVKARFKPKTGKAIMTDTEIYIKHCGKIIHNGIPRRELGNVVMDIIKEARQEGIAEGRAEQDKRRDIPNKNRQSMAIYRAEKQAYAKGFKDGTAKYYSRDYAKGVADGQSDFKAKLLNYSKGNVVYGYSMKSRQIISDAIKEAERK